MIIITKGHPKHVEQFLALANTLPFNEMLNRYLDNLKNIPANNMLTCMISFNELVADNPEFRF